MPSRWAKDDWNWIVVNGKDYRIITIKEVYEKCLAEAGLFQALINNLDGTLESHQYAMHKKCHAFLKEALELFKQGKPIYYGRGKQLTSAEVQAWIDAIVKWLAWTSKKLGDTECPWGECPPVVDMMRKVPKKPTKRPKLRRK